MDLNKYAISDSEKTPPPPNPESSTNILNALNDDCLQEIFRYLSSDELGMTEYSEGNTLIRW